MKYFFCLFFLFASSKSFAETDCSEILDGKVSNSETLLESQIEHLKKLAEDFKLPEVSKTADLIAGMRTELGKGLSSVLVKKLVNFEEPIYQNAIIKIIKQIKQSRERNKSKALKAALLENLVPFFSEEQAAARVELFFKRESIKNLKHALGEMNLDELQIHVYGSDSANPEPESVLARFFAQVKAELGLDLKAEMRSFYDEPQGANKGPEKLFVSINEQVYPIFQKYFVNEHFLIHTHSPSQGTLNISFNNENLSYAGQSKHGETRAGSENSMWPLIFFSSAEAQRAALYFRLGELSAADGYNIAKHPNYILDKNDKPYVKQGGYTCCTHWFGEMPLGEELVSEYRFPGQVDRHATNYVEGGSAAAIISPIGVPDKVINGRVLPLPALTHIVWKSRRGHMQMWQMLNLRDSLDNAELTNPGYILYALLGKTEARRVPLVFVFKHDLSLPSNTSIRENISYY